MEMNFIETQALNQLKDRIRRTIAKVEELSAKSCNKVQEWLDSQEVCLLLGISHRSLQYYRSRGIIAYSMIDNKVYYNSKDVASLIQKHTIFNK